MSLLAPLIVFGCPVIAAASMAWAIAAHQSFRKLKLVTENAIADRDAWRDRFFALKYRVQGTEAVLPEVYGLGNLPLSADYNDGIAPADSLANTQILGMANRKH